jgi:hypothetical protein
MKISYVVLVLFVTVFVSSCSDMGVLTVVTPPNIIVHVNNAGVANITTPASGKCKVSNQGKNGCIHFNAGETGLVNFKRTGPPNWAFSSFQICKISGDGNICDLNIWERVEFAVTDDDGTAVLIPDESGKVDLTLLGDSLDAFILLNQNSFAQDYYYSVDVCNSVTRVCDTADPPIENGGTH